MAQVLDIARLMKKLALIEAEGVGFYRSLAEHTENRKIKKLSQMMARAELGHQQGFEKLSQSLEKRRRAGKPNKVAADLQKYILTLIDHRIFLSPEQAATLAKNVADLNEAVSMAISFEKENILLLRECREIASGATRKIIEKIIEEEKSHIVGLQKAGQELAKMA